jgi:hypothetical protein
MKNYIYLILISFFSVGCAHKPFQPPPYTYDTWKKNGASITEIQVALLECGIVDPTGYNAREVGDQLLNDQILVELCMEKNGFISTRKENICKVSDWGKLPACQPSAVIPTPNAQRRLESKFCKVYPNADACQRRD